MSNRYTRTRTVLALGGILLLPIMTTGLRGESSSGDDSSAHAQVATSQSVAGQFTTFAGSSANAQALVTALNNGSATTLKSTVGGTTTATAFTPPTGKLGFGEVEISLGIAQADLVKAGITNPTPAQIVAALNGGSVTSSTGATTQLKGVLTLRASGKGWGKVAKATGVKLGQVESNLRATDRMNASASADAKVSNGAIPATPAVPARGATSTTSAISATPAIPAQPAMPSMMGSSNMSAMGASNMSAMGAMHAGGRH